MDIEELEALSPLKLLAMRYFEIAVHEVDTEHFARDALRFGEAIETAVRRLRLSLVEACTMRVPEADISAVFNRMLQMPMVYWMCEQHNLSAVSIAFELAPDWMPVNQGMLASQIARYQHSRARLPF